MGGAIGAIKGIADVAGAIGGGGDKKEKGGGDILKLVTKLLGGVLGGK